MVTFNLISYLIYGLITYLITVRIGWICYQNGYHFILAEIKDEALTESINKILLTCYYLLNLGYITLMIFFWEDVFTLQQMVESICKKTGNIVLSLGILHVMNMTAIYLMRKKSISKP